MQVMDSAVTVSWDGNREGGEREHMVYPQTIWRSNLTWRICSTFSSTPSTRDLYVEVTLPQGPRYEYNSTTGSHGKNISLGVRVIARNRKPSSMHVLDQPSWLDIP